MISGIDGLWLVSVVGFGWGIGAIAHALLVRR